MGWYSPAPSCCRFAWALQLFVLAATVAAWATRHVHSFKSSVWAMAAVVIYASLTPMNRAYLSLDSTTVSG